MRRLAIWAGWLFVAKTAALLVFEAYMLWQVVTGAEGLSGANLLAVIIAAYFGVGTIRGWHREREACACTISCGSFPEK